MRSFKLEVSIYSQLNAKFKKVLEKVHFSLNKNTLIVSPSE